ncbi:MAG: TIGR02530 family flagellar biosynthesis protein [Agathobacter sp.]
MNHPISAQFSSIEQISNQYLSSNPVKNQNNSTDISFEEILKEKRSEEYNRQILENSSLKFSKHAAMRLTDRHINLTQEMNTRLENGVEQASEKGIQESLVLVDSLAFIVNVPNRTVVTAMDKNETLNNVFTNIDGAVIM